jgi:hypothetical protein
MNNLFKTKKHRILKTTEYITKLPTTSKSHEAGIMLNFK